MTANSGGSNGTDTGVTRWYRGRPSPPYSIGLCIFIDGQTQSEQDSVWEYPTINPDKCCYIHGRTVVLGGDSNGDQLVETKGWKFGGLGIEVEMGKLSLGNWNDSSSDEMSNKNKMGQIVVRLDRCVVNGDTKTMSGQIIGTASTFTASAHTQDVTHEMHLTDATAPSYAYNSKKTRSYLEDEPVYASYVFQYMGRDKLMKLGLCDEHGIEIRERAVASLSGPTTPTSGVSTNTTMTHKREACTDDAQAFVMVMRPKRRAL